MEPGDAQSWITGWNSNDEAAREHVRDRLSLLLKLVVSGNKLAMSEVYKLTSGRLYSLLLQMLSNPGDADEVLQDAYLTVWRKAPSYSPGQASPMTWLITITWNEAIERLRSDKSTQAAGSLESLPKDPVDDMPSALGLIEMNQEHQRSEAVGNDVLSADIAHSEESLTRMAEDLRPVTPPRSVWQHIESVLIGMPSPAGKKTAGTIHTSVVLASLWDNIALWRGVSFACMVAVAAASIVALVLLWQSSVFLIEQNRLVAALQAAEGQALFVATYDPQRQQIVIVPVQIMNETERVPKLWLVTKDKRIISLGMIASKSAQAVVIPPDLVADTRAGAGLVITLEPPDGAPGDVATGPTIAQGELSPI